MMDKPNFLERLRWTLDFWRYGTRYMAPRRPAARAPMAVPTWPGEAKAAPFLWSSWRMGQPQWQIVNYTAYAQEGFNENAVVYSAIMYKVRSITIAPLRAYGGTQDEPELLPADPPLQRLAARPNRYMSWSEFQGIAEVYLNLAGNVYIYVEPDPDGGPVPKALWLLRPDRTYIVPHPDYRGKTMKFHPTWRVGEKEKGEHKALLDAGGKALKARDGDEKLLGFYYVPEGKSQADGVPYLPQQVIHVKLPNPLDPLDGLGYGLSPVSPMARSADVDNQVTKYLKLFFEKGAMPPGLLKFDVPMTDVDVARARERWMEIYGGTDEMHKIAVLDQGGEYQRLGLSFDEMGFEVIDERSEARITGPFGVPPILIGTRIGLSRATYANYQEARKAFWEDTMAPELRWFEADYQYYLQGERGEFVAFDLSRVPALTPTEADKKEAAATAFKSGGITRNEYRSVLKFDPVEGGDVYLIPMTLIEVPARGFGEEGEAESETEEGAPGAQEQAEGEEAKAIAQEEETEAPEQSRMTAEQKAAFWKQMDAQARSWEKRFGDAAAEAFGNDLREILAIVSEGKAKALQDKATVAWGTVLLAVTDYLAMAGKDNWRKTFVPVVSGLIVDRATQLNAEFGMEFDVYNVLTSEFLDSYLMPFTEEIIDVTDNMMSQVFRQAMEEGWSIPTMQKHLEEVFGQWMGGDLSPEDFAWFEQRMPAYRRENISRTESIRASGRAADMLYNGWGIQLKQWYSAIDERRCPWCAEMHEKIIKVGDSFWKRGDTMAVEMEDGKQQTMKFDYEDVISPPLHPMCRCTLLPYL